VLLHRPWRQDQQRRDLAIGHALRQEPQDLELAVREAGKLYAASGANPVDEIGEVAQR
jgi:hypothetical protein